MTKDIGEMGKQMSDRYSALFTERMRGVVLFPPDAQRLVDTQIVTVFPEYLEGRGDATLDEAIQTTDEYILERVARDVLGVETEESLREQFGTIAFGGGELKDAPAFDVSTSEEFNEKVAALVDLKRSRSSGEGERHAVDPEDEKKLALVKDILREIKQTMVTEFREYAEMHIPHEGGRS